jgi:hypothetical protein
MFAAAHDIERVGADYFHPGKCFDALDRFSENTKKIH